MDYSREQSICERAQAQPQPPLPGSKVGLAMSSLVHQPIHGLRVATTATTNGWYIWGGEFSGDADFFSPLHIEHLAKYVPSAVDYMDLPPGYRFLIDANNYEDVWFDADLLSKT